MKIEGVKKKMSKQVKIKEVIEVLCQLLYSHGFLKLQAEVLRQAKFNKKEAVLPLLELISTTLVHNLDIDLTEWLPLRKFKLVLSVLKRLDYPRLHNLYAEELHSLSSQELLLAFGFLVLQFDVIGSLRRSAEHLITNRIFDSCQKSCEGDNNVSYSPQVTLDHIIRLSKKIEFKWRDLDSSSGYLNKLVEKFESIDKSEIQNKFQTTDRAGASKRSHKVSLLDLIFFENFRLQEDCIALLKKQNELLRLHLKWTQNEPMFWKWMATVQPEQTLESCDIARNKTREKVSSTKWCSSVNIELLLKDILCKPGLRTGKPDSTDENESEKQQVFERELREIEVKIARMQAENKEWFTTFLCNKFPNVIQLPELKNGKSVHK